MKYQVGQHVVCNGNREAVIIKVEANYNCDGITMYTVRLWQGFRHVGDTIVSEADLNIENK